MSNVSSSHSVIPFVAGTTVALTAQRLSRVFFKKEKGKQAVCVSIPQLPQMNEEEEMQLKPQLENVLRQTQDAIIRAAVIAGKTEITDASISIAACIQHLSAATQGSRITKDDVASWFELALADNLQLVIGDKFGLSDNPSADQVEAVEKQVTSYKNKLTALAAGPTRYSSEVAKNLHRALKLAEDDCKNDRIYLYLSERLTKMSAKIEELVAI